MEKQTSTESRFIGCLLGVAIGDALGMPVEGWSADDIRMRFGTLSDFQPCPARGLNAGQFTDDTQMMLMHAESIVAMGCVDGDDLARRFVAWLRSGDVRGIGHSTLLSIKRLEQGTHWRESGQTGEFAAGNGVAMRIAPVGLFDCWHIEQLQPDVHTAGAITHRHPEALAGGLAVAYAVARLAAGEAWPMDLLMETINFIGECAVSRQLRQAQELLKSNVPAVRALAALGTTGYVVHTVSSAFYCFLRAPENFEQAVIEAVMAGGDADTTGAVAGALSGAYNGLEGIPMRWLEHVEGREYIEELARQIYALASQARLTKD